MLSEQTKDFDYICSLLGTGEVIEGISRFAENNQSVVGFKVINDYSIMQTKKIILR